MTVVWVRVGTTVTVDAVAVNTTVVVISVSVTMTRRTVILRVFVVLSIGLVVVMVILGLEVALLALGVRLLVVAVVVDVLADGLVMLGSNHGAVVLIEMDLRVAVDWLVMSSISAGGMVCGHVSTETMTTVVGTVGVTWVAIGVAVSVACWVAISVGTVGTVAEAWMAISDGTAVTISVVRGSVGKSSCACVVVGWHSNSGVIFSVVLVTMMVAVVTIVVRSVVVLGVRPVLDVLGRVVTLVVSVDFSVVVVELVVGLSLSLSVSDGSNNGKSKRSHLYFSKRFFYYYQN